VTQDADTIASVDGGTAAAAAPPDDRPELYVAAAFAGAFLFARILKRIAG
jgi:hypothetical protein